MHKRLFALFREISGHTDVLRRLMHKVSATMNPQTVARCMFENDSLTQRDLQTIQSKLTEPIIAADYLLKVVINRSPDVYSCFLHALRQTGQQRISELIVAGNNEGTVFSTNFMAIKFCLKWEIE